MDLQQQIRSLSQKVEFLQIQILIAYNRFNAKVDSLAMTYENFSDEFAAILHRRVHQRGE